MALTGSWGRVRGLKGVPASAQASAVQWLSPKKPPGEGQNPSEMLQAGHVLYKLAKTTVSGGPDNAAFFRSSCGIFGLKRI